MSCQAKPWQGRAHVFITVQLTKGRIRASGVQCSLHSWLKPSPYLIATSSTGSQVWIYGEGNGEGSIANSTECNAAHGVCKNVPHANPAHSFSPHAQTNMTSTTYRTGRSFQRNSSVISDHLTLAGPELIGMLASHSTTTSACGSVRLIFPAWQTLFPPSPGRQQNILLVGSAGRGQRVDDVIPADAEPTSSALPFRAPTSRKWLLLPNVSVTAASSAQSSQCPLSTAQFRGRPTNCRHVSCFVHYAALFPSPSWPQIGPPRFNWRRKPTAQADRIRPVSRVQGRYTGHAGKDRQHVLLLLAGHYTSAPRCHRDR